MKTITIWFQNYVILDSNKTIGSSGNYAKMFQNYVILDSNKTITELGNYI